MTVLKPDYTEQTVSMMIQMFLTSISFRQIRYTIELFSQHRERWLGADALLTERIQGIRPFYMQFKRPYAWPGASRSQIIRDRQHINLPVDPTTMFFKLRDRTAGQNHFQHNILHRLRRRLRASGLGDAAYVCPLFMNAQQYLFQVHAAALTWGQHMPILQGAPLPIRTQATTFLANPVPVFSQHVIIPAHEQVTDARHSYSFTEDGTQICFHSPQSLLEGSMPFSDWLFDLFGNLESPLITPSSAASELGALLEESELDRSAESFIGQEGFKSWFAFGDFLLDVYGIHQYAFVRWSE